jgi:hypothetical protein
VKIPNGRLRNIAVGRIANNDDFMRIMAGMNWAGSEEILGIRCPKGIDTSEFVLIFCG